MILKIAFGILWLHLLSEVQCYKPDSCEKAYQMYFPYKTTFASACLQLDNCYKYEQLSKSDCDVAFHYDLVMTCMHNKETPFGTFPYETCIKMAQLYFKTAKKYGQAYYG